MEKKNVAVIFAGGVGKRMGNDELPKQFIEVSEKPIIIHTLKKFEDNSSIDAIIISSIEDWIGHLETIIKEHGIKKVKAIVPGGSTGQMSIFNGLNKAIELYPGESTVLIHDGVRPFIDNELINTNIQSVEKYGSAISSFPATETFTITDSEENIIEIPKRSNSLIAKAPQSFVLKEIYEVHLKAQEDKRFDFIDSCTLMFNYNKKLKTVLTDNNNIKITTPKDLELAELVFSLVKK